MIVIVVFLLVQVKFDYNSQSAVLVVVPRVEFTSNIPSGM